MEPTDITTQSANVFTLPRVPGDTVGPVTVSIVNDFELVAAGLAGALAPFHDRVQLIEPGAMDEPVGVALLDTYGQRELGLPNAEKLLSGHVAEHVLLFTFSTDPRSVELALAAGASGVVAKSVPAEELVAAIEKVASGGRAVVLGGRRSATTAATWPGRDAGLTERESELLVHLAEGRSNQQIGRVLFLSENTVKTHLKRVYRKLGVSNRAQAAVRVAADPSFRTRSTGFTG